MYRRGDPRWNRTIQHITDNIEHANESAQEGIWTFTHDYLNPCFASFTQCLNDCTTPCFPSRDDRRRRGRGRGRAEMSFDFYDDWEEEDNDGLLGWGNDELDRLLAGSSSYGGVTQPDRQRAMNYGTRNRDARYNTARRKSAVQPHDGGPDPTIIPSSSYFGFLGRLPFKIGGKVLRYKPSAADLTEHPGQSRRSQEEQHPLIEDSDEDSIRAGERKGHRRQRSQTSGSGHTTDSLSSRGDIFPSEDEDDAVPLDDEFTLALERRATGRGLDDTSSGKTRAGSNRPSRSHVSTRTASSRNTHDSGKRSTDDANMKRSASSTIKEVPTLSDLKQEEERVRIEEEREIERKRQDAQQLALKRGLASDLSQSLHLQTSSAIDNSNAATKLPRSSSSPHLPAQMSSLQTSTSPLLRSPAMEPAVDAVPFPAFDPQTAPDSSSFHVDESDYSSLAPTPNRPLSLRDEARDVQVESGFVPAMLPHFNTQPD
ncbi:uncharacterized protein BDR25DRAFT_301447 [Lindgomyces ingoldianus]|uniref:Uncharacterized protein n=1 Tax=Lindgomyces ingoldianus TaxID=673940 RepID=A0ACB6R8H3_9PLEO|nr:uncharacterized protein BDR25DRAFT_301447 [Lindgomyces ingoldianus]KAF2474822.1 hypothetical protein BDR25DRAFT_301447 [Lindgomyces ingoldianus]